jgi:oligopeptidase B
MKKLLFVIALYALSENSQAQFSPATAPVASIETHWRVIQGDSVLDNYYWMYDYFGKGPDSTKAVDYLVAENKYLDTVMQSAKKMRTDLFNEMKSRIKEKDQSPPSYHHGYFYYSRSDDGAQYYKYCRKKGSMDAKEEILLDVDKMAEGHPYYAATGFDISTDNKLMAYGVDTVSRRQYVIFVKNLETGETFKEHIVNTQGDPCWANDNKTFFYTAKNPETLLSEKIKRHSLGSDVSADPVVYEEKDKSNYIGVYKSKNDQFIFIRSQATMSSEWRWIKANQPVDAFTVFQPRMKNVLYSVIPVANEFLIRTNKDSATNFKIMKCP